MAISRPHRRLKLLYLVSLFTAAFVWPIQSYKSSTQSSVAAPLNAPPAASIPTFYRDILPILQQHCQPCHSRGGIAPMPFETYDDTRRYAKVIRNVSGEKSMPPPFAIPEVGQVANDPSLAPDQIATLKAWADAQAPAGNSDDAPPRVHTSSGWTIGEPNVIVKMLNPVQVPTQGNVEYEYEIVPTHFSAGRWIQAAEVLPSLPANLHHAVIFIRPNDSKWLRNAPVGRPFTATTLVGKEAADSAWTDTDILVVYAPGNSPEKWPSGMAKFIPRGADLIFQMQYTGDGSGGSDQTSVGLLFSKQPPVQRILTLQLANHDFVIPPNVPEYRVEASGILPQNAMLLSCFPLMHLRGKRFEYNIVHRDQPSGAGSQPTIETLLRVNYDFRWQMNYPFVKRRLLTAGSELQAVAWYDNSPNNPRNPDPSAFVRWGESPSHEMMAGFFDVIVPANADRRSYSLQH